MGAGDDGWGYSTEGDLDPDLAEDAGHAGWEPPRRDWWGPAARVALALVLAAMLLLVALAVLR